MIAEIDRWAFLARIGFVGSISSIDMLFSSPDNFATRKMSFSRERIC